MDNTELRLVIQQIRKKKENNTQNTEVVFRYLDELLEKNKTLKASPKIGFKVSKK